MAILLCILMMCIVAPLAVRGVLFLMLIFGPGRPLFTTFVVMVVIYQLFIKRR